MQNIQRRRREHDTYCILRTVESKIRKYEGFFKRKLKVIKNKVDERRREGKEGEARNEIIQIVWQKLWREWWKHIVEIRDFLVMFNA